MAVLGRVFATVAWSRVGVELSAEMSTPLALDRPDGSGFSERLLFVGLGGCGSRTWLSACLLAKAGQIRVVGTGVDFPATSSGLLFQTGLRLAASKGLGSHAYVSARADGLVLLTRGIVTLDAMPVWVMPHIAALVGIDIGVRFR